MFMCMPIISMISIGVISISITITNLCSVFIGVGIMISTSSTYVRKYIQGTHLFSAADLLSVQVCSFT